MERQPQQWCAAVRPPHERLPTRLEALTYLITMTDAASEEYHWTDESREIDRVLVQSCLRVLGCSVEDLVHAAGKIADDDGSEGWYFPQQPPLT